MRTDGGRGPAAPAGAGGGPVPQGPPTGPALPIPRQRQAPPGGPRQEYLDAFDDALDEDDVFAPPPGRPARNTDARLSAPAYDAARTGAVRGGTPDAGAGEDADAAPARPRGGKGRTFTGIAAAAVTTVLAVVVAGQVADGEHGTGVQGRSTAGRVGEGRDTASAGTAAGGASAAPDAVALTYEQKMDRTYPMSPTLKGSGKLETVPGFDKAPGRGRKYTYRVDVEQGLGLDGALFAQAVQKTLNDDRSWAHHGARTFERISSGDPDFVITLASPGTTAQWCAKSGLDTTEDNVPCDSAATERVMINAYRWAQGSRTYGDEIHAYRQMLINHEVGHRLGHGHVTCDKDGELAPVMQQQTKFLDHDGIHCLPNPWPYPEG
jgi:hypothetical protein